MLLESVCKYTVVFLSLQKIPMVPHQVTNFSAFSVAKKKKEKVITNFPNVTQGQVNCRNPDRTHQFGSSVPKKTAFLTPAPPVIHS